LIIQECRLGRAPLRIRETPVFKPYRKSFLCWLAAIAAALGAGVAPAAAQSVTNEYPLPTAASQPEALAFGPDGNLWFTEFLNNKIGVISTSGTILHEYAVRTNNQNATSEPLVIILGPDGNLWFTLESGSGVGRITPSGTITYFNTPTTSSGPEGLTVGSDGNMWFTEANANKIGTINLGTGTVSEFAIPTSNSSPARIAAGPDGNLWFTEAAGNKIGVISTSGTVLHEFPIPTSSSQPVGIQSAFDGTLVFVEKAGSKIANITTSGAITEFPTPTANAGPAGLAYGPDGHFWFSENTAGQIGRIGQSGNNITEYPIPTQNAAPGGLRTGPDGALWFTEESGNKIARLQPTNSTIQLFAAVLPSSRSVQNSATATAFATIINASPTAATGCQISAVDFVPVTSGYQTTNPTTNALSGTVNTPANIAANSSQTFVLFATTNASFPPTDFKLAFFCANANAAPIQPGLDTLLFSSSVNPVPDIIALVATASNDGTLHMGSATGNNSFAVATDNIGAGSAITATANTGTATLPLALALCQTNPQTGQCLATPAASATTTINSGDTPTFAIFATASGTIATLPQTNRIIVNFTDSSGVIHGSTSVAVQTQ